MNNRYNKYLTINLVGEKREIKVINNHTYGKDECWGKCCVAVSCGKKIIVFQQEFFPNSKNCCIPRHYFSVSLRVKITDKTSIHVRAMIVLHCAPCAQARPGTGHTGGLPCEMLF